MLESFASRFFILSPHLLSSDFALQVSTIFCTACSFPIIFKALHYGVTIISYHLDIRATLLSYGKFDRRPGLPAIVHSYTNSSCPPLSSPSSTNVH